MSRPGPRGHAVVRAIFVVLGSSSVAILLGVLKNALAAYYFGTSRAMDAYLVALLLPEAVIQLARTGAFNFIPLFGAERQRSEAEAWQAAGKMLTYWLLLLLLILAVALLTAPAAMTMLAAGFDTVQRSQVLELAWVLFSMSALLGSGRILGVILHAERRFLTTGLAEVAFQLGSVAFLVAFREIGIGGLAWAQVFGAGLYLVVCAGGLFDRRKLLRLGFDLHNSSVRRLMRLSLPVYLADAGDKLNQMLTRTFASLFRPGTISALQFGYFPVEGLHRMITVSVVTALFPFLSALVAQGNPRRAATGLSRTVVAAVLLFLPLSAMLWLLADPLVAVLFERGSFDAYSTQITARALRLFAPSVFALALNDLIGYAFHAHQDTLTPMRAGYARVATHTVLCFTLTPFLGYGGLALAATISLYIKLLMLVLAARVLFTPGEGRRTLRQVVSVAAAVGVMLASVTLLLALGSRFELVRSHALLSLLAAGALCLISYAIGLWLLARRQLLAHLALARRALRLRRGSEPGALLVAPRPVAERTRG